MRKVMIVFSQFKGDVMAYSHITDVNDDFSQYVTLRCRPPP